MKSFHMGVVTGLVDTLASGNRIFGWRLPLAAARRQYFERVKFRVLGTVNPTVRQEFAVGLHLVSGMAANPSSGTDCLAAITTTTRDLQRIRATDRVPASVVAAGNVMVATTGNIGITGTVATQPFISGRGMAPIAATEQLNGAPNLDFTVEWTPATMRNAYIDPVEGCIPLDEDTGICLQVPVAIANGLIIRCGIEIDWLEE